jgi:S-layer family protein
MGTRGLLVSLVAVAAAIPSAAQAQSTLRAGGELRVNDYTIGAQRRPSAAMWADGSFVVVWESQLQDGDLFGVFGRRFDPTGAPLGPEFQVNQATLGDQTQASVALDAQGRFTVAWRGEDASAGGIFVRQFTAAGPVGPERRVNVYTAGEQALPRVSAGPNGLVVVWQSDLQDGSGVGVYGRLLTADAVPVGVEIPLSVVTAGNQTAPVVAALPSGRYAVAWLGRNGSFPAVISRLFDGAGAPLNGERLVASNTLVDHVSIASGPYDTFTVSWWEAFVFSGKGGVHSSDYGVMLRYHDANGVPGSYSGAGGAGQGSIARWEGALGTNFIGRALVSYTSAPGVLTCFHIPPDPTYCTSNGPEDGSGSGVFARAVGSPANPPRVAVNTYTTGNQSRSSVGADPRGNAVVAWQSDGQDGSGMGVYAQRYGGFFPSSLAVDPAGNGVLDPGASEQVRPSWWNRNGAAQALGGSAWGYSGPAGATYTVTDGSASYGTVANGAVQSCTADCYHVSASPAPGRPALHWDSYLGESLAPEAVGVHSAWTLHVGGSFTDVSPASPFYRFIETLLHNGVNGGCGGTSYCPTLAFTRDEMARSLLVALHGAGYAPPACGTPVFADVPAASPYCPWIEELARRGVVGGCGGGNYCPTAGVNREQLPVFVLRTLDPALTPPPCGVPRFADVPAGSPFCRWIEELARRGVVGGCGGASYCPTGIVSREQMAVFISASFGLRLY